MARNLAMSLSTTLHIESVEGAQGLGVDAFVMSVEALDMFEDEPPPALLALARVWFLKRQVGGINLADRMEAAEGGNAAGLGRGAGAGGNPEGNVFANMTDKDKDLLALALTEGELTALSLSIETGICCTPLDACDLTHGADPLMGDFVKKRNKAKMDSLKTHLDAKDHLAIARHFSNLIHDLTSAGKNKEVAIITSWWMEVQQVFATNPEGMIAYIKEYLRRYRGRTFPVAFDVSIFAKSLAVALTSSKTATLSEDQKDMIKQGKQAMGKVEQLTSKVANLSEKLAALQGRVGGGNQGASGGGKTCDFCNRKGHIARFCRVNPDSSNYDEAEANKWKAAKAAKEAEEEE